MPDKLREVQELAAAEPRIEQAERGIARLRLLIEASRARGLDVQQARRRPLPAPACPPAPAHLRLLRHVPIRCPVRLRRVSRPRQTVARAPRQRLLRRFRQPGMLNRCPGALACRCRW